MLVRANCDVRGKFYAHLLNLILALGAGAMTDWREIVAIVKDFTDESAK
jgi:hypothetical protein